MDDDAFYVESAYSSVIGTKSADDHFRLYLTRAPSFQRKVQIKSTNCIFFSMHSYQYENILFLFIPSRFREEKKHTYKRLKENIRDALEKN